MTATTAMTAVTDQKIPTFPLAFFDRLRMATDGAGVTALVGAYGCPLQCKLCINPQTWHERSDGKASFERVTPVELYDRVKIDSLYYLATGGGITFGGGEPLLHTDFITAFRALCICNDENKRIHPRGLDKDARYEIRELGMTLTGATIMNVGFLLPNDMADFKTFVFHLRRV